MATILPNDTELRLPNFLIVTASAGAGKTHTLTLRILQLLLSHRVPNNRLNNILAMTFTRNAAAEMRQRVLEYLKKAYLGQPEILEQLLALVSMDEEQLHSRCGELIETILQDYSSFQVQTIDSFMARVFRASALEFGFSPTLEIVLDSRPLLDAAFEQFARELTLDPPKGQASKRLLLEQLTDILVDSQSTSSRYIWNPFQKLSDEVRKLYETLSAQAKDVVLPPGNGKDVNALREEILGIIHYLHKLVRESGLEMTKNFETVVTIAASGSVDDLIGRKSLYSSPVKKSGGAKIKKKVEEWDTSFAVQQERLRGLMTNYIVQQAHQYYRPYVEAHRIFSSTLEQIMRRDGRICLVDVNRMLLRYISEETVPQVYFYLGDAIVHYLIDEFQDTSPAQWEMMKPLFAETLSKQGSLFVVGDMKQSIYTFRRADWRIMRSAIDTVVFPSAPPEVRELETNYRSYEKILEFTKKVFHEIVPQKVEGKAPHASGLSSFKQEVEKSNKQKGYVEVVSLKKDEENESQRDKILEIVAHCHACSYHYGDITILTPKNDDVVSISGWLNGAHIPFISHSSLDIRGRSITGDIIALLRFLDSPVDNISFATFLLSDTFRRILIADGMPAVKEEFYSFILQTKKAGHSSPLYTSFRSRYKSYWDRYFDELFDIVGYLPMYDLVSEIYKQFRLFDLRVNEEGTLVKLLEVIKDFEEKGRNNLKDFLAFVEEEGDEADWNVTVPRGVDAVSVMTIHKAKGLDNRVVIVLLVDSKPRADNLFVEETEEGVRLVRITQKTAEQDGGLQTLYDRKCLEHTVDDLNKLYVACTRAREEMYIISVTNDRVDEPSKFLPVEGYETSAKPSVERKEKPFEPIASVVFSAQRLPPSIVVPEKLALYERKRGEAIHDILSKIEFVDAHIESIISTAAKEIVGSWMGSLEIAHLVMLVLEFLQVPDVMPFFARVEGRSILNEQEFVNPEGRLFRMDRIVVDAQTITVVDFKTGEDKDSYTDQLHGYVEILSSYYPGRAILGALAFVDRKKVRLIA